MWFLAEAAGILPAAAADVEACMTQDRLDPAVTRRAVLATGGAAGGLAVIGTEAASAQHSAPAVPAAVSAGEAMPVTLRVNGQTRHLVLDSRTTLLDMLREHLNLTGSKKGCDHGQCGACTILLNGRRINSCLSLAVMHDGDELTTIEGLGEPGRLHPLQAAFVHHDGYQCGYCTPGQICSAAGMLAEASAGAPSVVTDDLASHPELSDAEIRERMSGNICRCSAYPNIVAAIRDVARNIT